MSQIRHVRGDSFLWTATYKDGGVPADVTNIDIKAQVRTKNGDLVQDLTVTKLFQGGTTLGQFTISCLYSVTSGWPVGVHSFDIQYTRASDSFRFSTETVSFVVLEDVSQ